MHLPRQCPQIWGNIHGDQVRKTIAKASHCLDMPPRTRVPEQRDLTTELFLAQARTIYTHTDVEHMYFRAE